MNEKAAKESSAADHYRHAQQAIKAGKFDDALQLLEACLALEDHAEAIHDKAVIFHMRGNTTDAIALLQRAVSIRPDYAQAYDNIARMIVQTNGDLTRAIEYMALAINADPARPLYKDNFIQLAGNLDFKFFVPEIAALIVACLETPGIEHDKLAQAWFSLFRRNPEFRALHKLFGHSGYASFKKQLGKTGEQGFSAFSDSFFLLGLTRLLIPDMEFETFAGHLRRALLEDADYRLGDAGGLPAALSYYCRRTGYLIDVDATEMQTVKALLARVENDKSPPERDVTILACYEPLTRLTNAGALVFSNPDFLRIHLTEPLQEKKYAGEIEALTPIGTGVSEEVRAQYEAFPYPRWETLGQALSAPVQPVREVRHILIAGCGTGKEALQFARAFPDADILAIDMSLASLSYALRKAREFEIGNITFRQADLLQLSLPGTKFDIISSSGVLHHLARPAEGLSALTSLLADDGMMQIGLYSRTARRHLFPAMAAIREIGYGNDLEEIRRFRRDFRKILNTKDASQIAIFRDFYTAPECRDLLFHVQEHCFDIQGIKDLIANENMEIITFSMQLTAERLYRAANRADSNLRDLEGIAAFEQKNPNSFIGMYNFWMRRR